MAIDLSFFSDDLSENPANQRDLALKSGKNWIRIHSVDNRIIRAYNATSGGRANLYNGGATGAGQSFYLGGSASTHADVMVSGVFHRTTSTNGRGAMYIFLRGSGTLDTTASFNGYALKIESAATVTNLTATLVRFNSGVESAALDTSAVFSVSVTTDVAYSFSCVGNVISATVPGDTLSYTDVSGSAISSAGRGGVGFDINGTGGDNFRVFALNFLQESSGAPTPVSFSGTVPAQSAVIGTAFSLNVASYFSGSLTPFSYNLQTGTLPAGLSLSGSTISGTPTTAGTSSGLVIRATDTGSNTANTNGFNIVVASTPTGPTINTHPANQSVTAPTAATFTVAATTSGGTLTYQWQVNTGSGWANVSGGSGATTASYTTVTTTTGMSGYQYRCIVNDASGVPVNSNAATLTVSASSTGSITTEVLQNNTTSGPLVSTAVHWSWLPSGRFGSLSGVTAADGTGTTNGSGVLTVSGLPLGAGILLVAARGASAAADAVYYQAGTVA